MQTTIKNTIAENGFSLIEVLVALFVLALGVVGAIAMQLTALRTTQQTVQRTQALYLASEIADSFASLPMQMLVNDGHLPELAGEDSEIEPSATNAGNCYQIDSPCDVLQLAKFNYKEWSSRIQKNLPKGRFRICRDSANRNMSDQIDWACDESSSAPLVVKVAWRQKIEATASDQAAESALAIIALPIASYRK